MTARIPRVLSIAGTDPTGGAGIQADLKSIAALGGYGMAVVTTLVAQNTLGVRSVHAPPAGFLREQLDAVGEDVELDAVKIGMLHSTPLVNVVDAWLAEREIGVVVLDPVMLATSGDRLLDKDAQDAVRRLCRRAHLVTPNLPELAVLSGEPVACDWPTAITQATRFAASANTMVLVKGGHLEGPECPDAIVTADGIVAEVTGGRMNSANTHGTGCSLSSAIATLCAGGLDWPEALTRAKAWLTDAIAAGAVLNVGQGNGPVDHLHELRPYLPVQSWAAKMWAVTVDLRAEIDACAFVRDLSTGDLADHCFRWYLTQDALYLGEYSRVLARASALAPRPEEQVFWAESAATAITVETELHRSLLDPAATDPTATTLAYTNHLHASGSRGSYAELVAALLPCFWLYSDLGERFRTVNHPEHPYSDWLATYADPAFAHSTRTAVSIADKAAAQASPAERERMQTAFTRSIQHELEFFTAPLDWTPQRDCLNDGV